FSIDKANIKLEGIFRTSFQWSIETGSCVFFPIGIGVLIGKTTVPESYISISIGDGKRQRKSIPLKITATVVVIGGRLRSLDPGHRTIELRIPGRTAVDLLKGRVGDMGRRFRDLALTIRIIEIGQTISVVIDRIITYFYWILAKRRIPGHMDRPHEQNNICNNSRHPDPL